VTLRSVGITLMAAGLVVCLVPLGLVGLGMWQENQLTQGWDRSMAPPPTSAAAPASSAGPTAGTTPGAAATLTPGRSAPAPQAAFAIRVPKIGYYAAVREGVSLDLPSTGPGH